LEVILEVILERIRSILTQIDAVYHDVTHSFSYNNVFSVDRIIAYRHELIHYANHLQIHPRHGAFRSSLWTYAEVSVIVSELRQGCYVPEIRRSNKERLMNLYSIGSVATCDLYRKRINETRTCVYNQWSK